MENMTVSALGLAPDQDFWMRVLKHVTRVDCQLHPEEHLVVFDRKSLTQEQGDACVGGDSYRQGRSTAGAVAKILKEKRIKGKCIQVMGDLKDNKAVLRSKALGVAGLPGRQLHLPGERLGKAEQGVQIDFGYPL